MNITSVLRSTGLQARHTFYVDGVATAADGSVTYTVTKADGTTLTSGTAIHTAPYYTFDLAPQASLNLLTVAWTGVFSGLTQVQTDQIEVVGGYYVTLSELRALPNLSNMSTYPDDTLVGLRREFEQLVEEWHGAALVPRFARETYVGGGNGLLLRRPGARTLLSVAATDSAGAVTAYTTTNWRLSSVGQLTTAGTGLATSFYGDQNITIEYEHGADLPPQRISRACKRWVRNQALQDAKSTGRDVLRQVDENGFQIQYSTPDWNADRPTGLLEVDRDIVSLGRYPSVA